MAVVRGHVIARGTGERVPHARVTAFGHQCGAEAETDAHGAFVLTGLEGGAVRIKARGPGWASADPEMVGFDPGEEITDVRVLVDPAFTVSGRVVAGERSNEGVVVGERAYATERGIAGAHVGAMLLRHPGEPARAKSAADGTFELVGLLPGTYRVFAHQDALAGDGVTVEVIDSDVSDVRLAAYSGASLSGRIVPPTVAKVGLSPRTAEGMLATHLYRAQTSSDETGRFTLANVPAGELELVAMAADGRTGITAVSVGTEDVGDLTVELSPRRTIRGRVVDTAGAPLAKHYLHPSALDLPLSRRLRGDAMWRGAETSDDGSFELVGLSPGRWRLVVVRPPRATHAASLEVDLTDGDQLDVPITIDVPVAQIRGRVVGVDGAPAIGRFVMATSAGGDGNFGGSTQTDRHGAFVIANVPVGTYSLVVGDLNHVWATAAGVTTEAEVTIAIVPPSSLTIEVTRDGAPVREVTLHCKCGNFQQHAENVDGAHTFTEMMAGEYECVASGPAGIAISTVRVSGAAAVQIELADYAAVSGTAVDVLTGEPIAGLEIMERDDVVVTDAGGRFELSRVLPGSRKLLIFAKGTLGYRPDYLAYHANIGEHVDLGRVALPAPRRGEQGTFGWSLKAAGDVLRVERITKGGPADQAAIVVGDEVRTVAGHRVADLGIARAGKLLASDNVPIAQTLTVELASGRSVELTSVAW